MKTKRKGEEMEWLFKLSPAGVVLIVFFVIIIVAFLFGWLCDKKIVDENNGPKNVSDSK